MRTYCTTISWSLQHSPVTTEYSCYCIYIISHGESVLTEMWQAVACHYCFWTTANRNTSSFRTRSFSLTVKSWQLQITNPLLRNGYFLYQPSWSLPARLCPTTLLKKSCMTAPGVPNSYFAWVHLLHCQLLSIFWPISAIMG